VTGKTETIDWNGYVDAVSAMIGLPISTSHREPTIAQLKLNAVIAQPLLAFEIPEGTNPAPAFKP
jgi:Protein of unknown function (DUF4089)